MNQGDILVYKWGYEQTNVHWFVVTKATEKTATLQRIYSVQKDYNPQAFAGTCKPLYVSGPDGFKPKPILERKPFRKKITRDVDYGEYISMDYGIARLWDGTPQKYTSYA